MKTRTLVLAGLLSFVGFVLVSAPIATLWPRVADRLPALNLSGLSGSVFDGEAAAASVGGRVIGRPLQWSFSPWSLVSARLGYRVAGTLDGLVYEGRVAKSLSGATVVEALQASGSLRGLLALTGDVGLPVDGDVTVDVDTLKLVDGFPQRATATINLGGLRMRFGPQPQSLGDFALDVKTEADVIVARVSPTAGPLDVGGELRLMADRSYEVDLKVKAKPDAPPEVQNLVRTLGQADTDGYFRIKQRAQL